MEGSTENTPRLLKGNKKAHLSVQEQGSLLGLFRGQGGMTWSQEDPGALVLKACLAMGLKGYLTEPS